MAYKYVTIDIETEGLLRHTHNITYIGVGLSKELHGPISKYFIFKTPFTGDTLERFKALMNRCRRYKLETVFQNGKFDTLFIEYHLGIKLPIHHDVMLMGTAYDLAEKHGLKLMANLYLGVADWDVGKKEKTSLDDKKVIPYLKKDVRYTWELFCFFKRNMGADHRKIEKYILKPAFLMYRDVERYGIYIDQEELAEVSKKYRREARKALAVLDKKYKINWASPKQVKETMFGKNAEGISTRGVKLTNSGEPSTDAKVLKRLAAEGHELPAQLIEYKKYYGANSKFLNKWPDFIHPDGRIHPMFGLFNVVSGRTSCSEPNLQQVPRNPDLRNRFKAPPGRGFIEADYSQLELRIAAHYAKDPTMINVYNTGGDIHTETAKSLAGTDTPTKENRTRAKPVNFGFLYGMFAKGFVNYALDSYGVVFTPQEAERYRDLFLAKYSRLLPWHEEQAYLCEMNGGVYNLFGRFRKLPDIYDSNKWVKGSAARKAINTPVQGSGSDILLSAAAQVHKELRGELDVRICGTIHDSILMDFPIEYTDTVRAEVKRIMEHPQILKTFGVKLSVPLEADVGVGAWGIGH